MADESNDTAPNPFRGMNLKQKVVAIRKEMHNIEKTGHNEHFNYDFVEAGVLMGKIGSRLAEAGIIIGRRNLTASRSMEEKGAIVSLQCEYGLIDAESGDELWYASYGEGQDKSDKAAYKAWTGMFKYFLMQAFALAMGDDPEAEDVDTTDTPTTRKTPQNGSTRTSSDATSSNREPRASTEGQGADATLLKTSLNSLVKKVHGKIGKELGDKWLKAATTDMNATSQTITLKQVLELSERASTLTKPAEITTEDDDIGF